jgi:hypothetical protein
MDRWKKSPWSFRSNSMEELNGWERNQVDRYLAATPNAKYKSVARNLQLPLRAVQRYMYRPGSSTGCKSDAERAAEMIAKGPPKDWKLPADRWIDVVIANFGQPLEA